MRIRKCLPAAILIMLVISLLIGIKRNNIVILNCNSSNVEEKLKDRFKSRYYDIYDYKMITIKNVSIIKIYDEIKFRLPEFEGTQNEKLSKIIDYMSKFDYCENQPNPNTIARFGGNCQAFSILFKNICRSNGLNCSIDGTRTHTYNVVSMGENSYKVDLVNKKMDLIK